MAVHLPPSSVLWPRIAGFAWDAGNRLKCQKLGLSVGEIEALFHRRVAVFPDRLHSREEERFKAVGRTDAGRGVPIVFTLRQRDGHTLIRPISARYMHAREMAVH